jgi:hypothetical protein
MNSDLHPGRRAAKVALAVALLLALGACAAGSGESAHAADGGAISVLALGFWHGLIAPVMLIVELINKFAPHVLPWQVHVYETKAAGALYDLGFYFGLVGGPGVLWGGWSRSRR